MVSFTIEFDRPDRKYGPGETIRCVFRMNFDTSTKFSSIYARYQGNAVVKWSESTGTGKQRKSTSYRAEEIYFKQYQTVLGLRDGEGTVVEAGTYVREVFFQLPRKDLPQCYLDYYGKIQYEIKLHMNVPWGFDHTERAAFYVVPRFDLNAIPYLREPLHSEERKTFGFSFWKSGPLHIFCTLPKRGFVPGERAQYTIEVKNDSNVDIVDASIKLLECIKFHARSPRSKTRESSRTVWEYKFNKDKSKLVLPLQKKLFSKEILFEPATELKIFQGSDIITVKYLLQSTAHVSGMHSNLVNSTEVIIGNVPLIDLPVMPSKDRYTVPSAPQKDHEVPPSAPEKEESKEHLPSAPEASTSTNFHIEHPLPSYQEAVKTV